MSEDRRLSLISMLSMVNGEVVVDFEYQNNDMELPGSEVISLNVDKEGHVKFCHILRIAEVPRSVEDMNDKDREIVGSLFMRNIFRLLEVVEEDLKRIDELPDNLRDGYYRLLGSDEENIFVIQANKRKLERFIKGLENEDGEEMKMIVDKIGALIE